MTNSVDSSGTPVAFQASCDAEGSARLTRQAQQPADFDPNRLTTFWPRSIVRGLLMLSSAIDRPPGVPSDHSWCV